MPISNLKTLLASAALSATLAVGTAQDHHNNHTIQNVFENIETAGAMNAEELKELVKEFAALDATQVGNFYMNNKMFAAIMEQNEEDIGALFNVFKDVYDGATEDSRKAIALHYMIKGGKEDPLKGDQLWDIALDAIDSESSLVRPTAYTALSVLAFDNRERTEYVFDLLSNVLKDYDATRSERSTSASALASIGRDESYKQQAWDLLLEQVNRDITFNNSRSPFWEYDNKDIVLQSIALMGSIHDDLQDDAWDILIEDVKSDNPSAKALEGMSIIARIEPYYARQVLDGDEVTDLLSHDDFIIGAAAAATLFEAAYSAQWIAQNYLLDTVEVIEREFLAKDRSGSEPNADLYESYTLNMRQNMEKAIKRIDEEWGILDHNGTTPELIVPN